MKQTQDYLSQVHGFPVAPSVTRKGACAFLCISMSTLERLTKNKELTPIRIGGRVTYDLGDLIEFRKAHKEA